MQTNMQAAARGDALTLIWPMAGGSPAGAREAQPTAEAALPGGEYMLVDVGGWEFGLLHAALAELRRQGWEVADAQGAGAPRLRPAGGGLQIRLYKPARLPAQAS